MADSNKASKSLTVSIGVEVSDMRIALVKTVV
jgi:hypothetical protein